MNLENELTSTWELVENVEKVLDRLMDLQQLICGRNKPEVAQFQITLG